MLILLPPSEGKTIPEGGPALDLAGLAFAGELTGRREALLDKLEVLATRSPELARRRLGISAAQGEDVARDGALRTAPTAPAGQVYSGVLYERLDLGSLGARARERAAREVLIASALWGFVTPEDRIPYYRLSIQASLPRIRSLATWWKPSLAEAMAEREGELAVDMRSGPYAQAWRPKGARILPVKVFAEVDGRRKVVSHMAKATRGQVARLLLGAQGSPAEPEDVLAAVTEAGFTADLAGGALEVLARG